MQADSDATLAGGKAPQPLRLPPPNAREFWEATMGKGMRGVGDEWRGHIHRYQAYDSTCEAFRANKAKNRYPDVQCIDATRVVLNKADGGGDYIHASWVGGAPQHQPQQQRSTAGTAQHKPADAGAGGYGTPYICTQGPKEETIADFWRMVWQHEIACIGMLCDTVESGRKKCAQYWPEQKEETNEYGTFSITNVGSERRYLAGGNRCTIATLEMCSEGCAPRTVSHILWSGWPERSAPDDCRAILKMVKRLQSLAEGRPVVAHCSAGIGRTGTLAAVDAAMAKLDALHEIDIVAVVRRVREQRMHSVQTQQQYATVYKCIMDYIRARWPHWERVAIHRDFDAFEKDFRAACM